MKFEGKDIVALLAAWREQGHRPVFVAGECGAYVYDQRTGNTLQFVSPEGMRN